jgi:phosphonate transport system permease protein
MVGAGGIGMLLWESIRGFEYSATAAMLLIIIVVVSALDMVSAIIRKHFI